MDDARLRFLLIQEHKAFLSILDLKGVAYSPPFNFEELEKLDLSDLKRLVSQERDLARTPHGGG